MSEMVGDMALKFLLSHDLSHDNEADG